jgi:hypothetical protein
VVTGLVLLYGTGQVAGAVAHEEETVVTRYDAAGISRLDVHNDTGHVRVVGADTDEIVVTAEVSDGLRPTGHHEEVDGDTLEVRASCPMLFSEWCSVEYTIEVPADLDVVVRGDTTLTASDLAGDVDLSTDNGRIEAARVSGDLRMESDNGRVVGTDLSSGGVDAGTDNGRVELSFAEPPRAVTATSDNGSIEVVVPKEPDVVYRVDADSDNGSVSTLVATDRDSERTITAFTDNGSVTLRHP